MAEDCVDIECGTNKAKLFIAKLKGGNDSACVWFEDKWLTPIQFQDVSGRRASRDWKKSIKCGGKPLRELLLEGEVNLFSLESHESSLQASNFSAEASEEASAESDLIVANIPEGQKPLICVEHPAFVDDDERAVASLGGVENISNVSQYSWSKYEGGDITQEFSLDWVLSQAAPRAVISKHNTELKKVEAKSKKWGSYSSFAAEKVQLAELPLEARITEDDDTPIHIRDVMCLGHESALDDCFFRDNSTCTHDQDVAITCRPSLSSGIGDVRLIGAPENGNGAVQLRDPFRGFIGICPDDRTFDTTEATIVCRQLGYDLGSAIVVDFRDEYEESFTTISVKAQGFSCSSEDAFLGSGNCDYDLGGCLSMDLVGVVCTTNALPDGSIRLFGGSNRREGRVEILFNGRWGRVCNDNSWSTSGRNPEVVCSQLGFGTDTVSRVSDTFLGADSRIQPVWLGEVNCLVGSETLDGCSHLEPTGYADCYRSFNDFVALDCGGSDSGGGISSGAITGIVFAVIFIAFFVLPFGWAYGKEYWDNRERYSVYRCLVWPCRACSRCLDNCSMPDWSPTRNTNTRTTGATAVFSLNTNTNTAATRITELTPTNRPTTSVSESESEPEPERDEQEPELTKTAPPSYQAASHFPTADPTDLPPPYPGPPKLAEAGYPTAPGAYPPPTGGASYPPMAAGAYPPAGAGVYPPGGPGYPSGGDLAYPPVAVPGAGLQGYPPPTQAGAAYPPTLEPAYPPATATAPYPVETPQQHAPLDPVLAEELAHAPQETTPGSIPGALPYPTELTLDQSP